MTGGIIVLGKVSGQGSLYTSGNVYLPNGLLYDNPPKPHLPGFGPPTGTGYGNVAKTGFASMATEDIQAWRTLTSATSPAGTYAVRDADLVGLFARENIIIGRFTGGNSWGSVDSWLANADNQSKEDLGIDNLPNTGDTNENNNVWNVKYYAADGQGQCGSGLLPAGYAIGDVIPGSGEDIDGDARFDDRIQRGSLNVQGLPTAGSSSFALPENLNDRLNSSAADPNTAAPLDTDADGKVWRGSALWLDAVTTHSWNEIAPDPPSIPQIAGVLYNNHATAGVFRPTPPASSRPTARSSRASRRRSARRSRCSRTTRACSAGPRKSAPVTGRRSPAALRRHWFRAGCWRRPRALRSCRGLRPVSIHCGTLLVCTPSHNCWRRSSNEVGEPTATRHVRYRTDWRSFGI